MVVAAQASSPVQGDAAEISGSLYAAFGGFCLVTKAFALDPQPGFEGRVEIVKIGEEIVENTAPRHHQVRDVAVIEGRKQFEDIASDLARLQLTRLPRALTTMTINPAVKDIFAFKYEDFKLENYDPHPHIKAEVAV